MLPWNVTWVAAIAAPPPWGTRLTVVWAVNSAPWMVSVVVPELPGLARAGAGDLERQRLRRERERLAAARARIALEQDVIRPGLGVGDDDLLGRLRWRGRGGQVRAGGRHALVADVELAALERGEAGGDREVLPGGHGDLVVDGPGRWRSCPRPGFRASTAGR